MAKPVIGFVGVGLMGHGMAKNIVEKGYALRIVGNRNRTPVEDLVGRGAVEAATPRDLAAACDIVLLCVTDSATVEKIVRGPDGLTAGARPGLIVVDCSTADPNSTLALEAELGRMGITFCDAPLSRTPKDAWEGTLDVMVGADDATFETIEPVLATFAGRIVRVGAVGNGHKIKLLNNFVAMTYAAVYSEAFTLAKKIGIEPQALDSVLRGGRMDCGFYQTFTKYLLDRDVNAHRFTIRNAHKDLRYVSGLATASGVANWIGSAARNYYATAEATGHGDDNVPQLSDVIAGLNGTRLG
ncbi:NAD(P)-dependent oxidoreductase [Prosthecodimorpha staleyi]|uniref:NAD(P)-dependent oxidoreductase n=1 Tax=Prosthecodimorpha staleyi TaxID=2840188 RepID=A0A947D918_9HYPH|nr:NAD(P)-dependent oxidoreductase [Prosthecodimorpha staleyi]MBT9293251.1 NAD(P)-dependent oxidoreductase [Prosthecodimorpha staleyi]